MDTHCTALLILAFFVIFGLVCWVIDMQKVKSDEADDDIDFTTSDVKAKGHELRMITYRRKK